MKMQNLDTGILKKVPRTILFALLCWSMVACSPTDTTGSTCAAPAAKPVATAMQLSALAKGDAKQNLSLILKIEDVATKLQGLRQALVNAHAPAAHSLGKLTISAINNEMVSVQIPIGSPAMLLIDKWVSTNEIQYIEPDYQNYLVNPSAASLFNDPDLTKQWSLNKMFTYEAWKTTMGNPNLTVAVIDTGIDYTHQDLKNNMWRNKLEVVNGIDDDRNGFIDDIYGYNFANNNSNPMADDTSTYHGTHVAGTIAAAVNNSVGGSGIAPGVHVMAVKYLDKLGSGSTSNAIRAIDYAINNGAKIINSSWGSMNRSQALQDEIEKARKMGVLFVAAAGNGDVKGVGINLERTEFYPAGFNNDNIVSVAASDQLDGLTKWSNYGSSSVDIAAPGLNIWSTRNGNTYASLSGTSMATPAITGVISLIWSANPALSYLEVKNILLSSADKVAGLNGKLVSSGRANAANAVAIAASGVIAPAPGDPAPGQKPTTACVP